MVKKDKVKVETNQLQGIIAKAIERHSANGANTIERRALKKEQSYSKAKKFEAMALADEGANPRTMASM